MDVNTSFLDTVLNDIIYFKPPPVYEKLVPRVK